MDINLVAIDLGNTRLAIGAFIAGELVASTRLSNADRAAWGKELKLAWDRIEGRDNAAIVAASVNPPLDVELDEAVQRVTGRRVVWVGKDIELPIKVLTQTPEQTGVDRALNVAAAYEQMKAPCVVVDAGSAVTVDFCNEEGDFVGGAIAPGAQMMLDALQGKTAQLPRVSFAAPQEPIGRSTEQAMLHGVYHGIRGMVKELVENFATELGRWPDLIATGGDAQALFADWELVHAIAPDLTLYGIALAYAERDIEDDA